MLSYLLSSLLYIGARDYDTRQETIRREIAQAQEAGRALTQAQIEAKVRTELPQLRTASGQLSPDLVRQTASRLQVEARERLQNPYYLTGYVSGRNVPGTTISARGGGSEIQAYYGSDVTRRNIQRQDPQAYREIYGVSSADLESPAIKEYFKSIEQGQKERLKLKQSGVPVKEVFFSPRAYTLAEQRLSEPSDDIISSSNMQVQKVGIIRPQGDYKRMQQVSFYKSIPILTVGGGKNDNRISGMGGDTNLYRGIDQVLSQQEKRLAGFEQRVTAAKDREQAFFGSAGFQRIRQLSDFFTSSPARLFGGTYTPYESKGFVGKVGSNVLFGAMSFPIALGGALPMVGEKLAATGEGLSYSETRQNVFGEYKRAATSPEFLTTFDPRTPEGASTYITAAGFGLLGSGKANFGTTLSQKASKILYRDRYIPPEQAGIKFVESYTNPQSLKQLRGLEGKKATTIHVTTAEFPKVKGNIDFVTTAKPEGAGGFRAAYDLYQFYKSAPKGGEAQAYLGYAGILSKSAKPSSGVKIVAKEPTIKLLIGEDVISNTPRGLGKNVQTVNLYQGRQSGKTFVPAENIAGFSTEGQLISPAKYTGIKGYSDFLGSRIRQTGKGQFTYYTQEIENPFTNVLAKSLWDVFGRKSKTYRLELIPVETVPVEGALSLRGRGGVESSLLDIGRYNEIYSSRGRTITPSRPFPGLVSSVKSSKVSFPIISSAISSKISSRFPSIGVSSSGISSSRGISSPGSSLVSSDGVSSKPSRVSSGVSSGLVSSVGSSTGSRSSVSSILSSVSSGRSSTSSGRSYGYFSTVPSTPSLGYFSGDDFPKRGDKMAGTSREPGYHAYVKRRQVKTGKGRYKGSGYQRVTTEPLSKEGATATAMTILDRFTNRTGYVKKVSKQAKSRGPSLSPGLAMKFRMNKKNPNRFTEKSQFAIDSPEEVRGIPYAGIKQRQSRSNNTFLSRGINTRSRKSPSRRANFRSGGVSRWL